VQPNASMYRQNHRVSGINLRTIEGFAGTDLIAAEMDPTERCDAMLTYS